MIIHGKFYMIMIVLSCHFIITGEMLHLTIHNLRLVIFIVEEAFMFLLILSDEKSKSKYCKMYVLHENVMIRLAMNILKDQKYSEDVVQECFLAMLENENLMQKLGEPDSPATKSYLMMMVKSKAINLYRKIKRQMAVINDDDNLLYTVEDKSSDVETILANAGLLTDAKEYLSILDPQDINIMTLKYYKGFQNTEIAESIGIDSNLVGVRLYRAKKKLAMEIEKKKNQETGEVQKRKSGKEVTGRG